MKAYNSIACNNSLYLALIFEKCQETSMLLNTIYDVMSLKSKIVSFLTSFLEKNYLEDFI